MYYWENSLSGFGHPNIVAWENAYLVYIIGYIYDLETECASQSYVKEIKW